MVYQPPWVLVSAVDCRLAQIGECRNLHHPGISRTGRMEATSG